MGYCFRWCLRVRLLVFLVVSNLAVLILLGCLRLVRVLLYLVWVTTLRFFHIVVVCVGVCVFCLVLLLCCLV